jgi:hypothetical protein
MISLLFAVATIAEPSVDRDIALCKPALERKAGEIATMDVGSSKVVHGGRIIEGRLTAFAKMGPATAGFARTNHVGRFEFTYRCEIRHGRVRKTRLNPFKG